MSRDAIAVFTDPKQLLLDMAEQRAVDALLSLVVTRLADSPRVALSRVWLILPPGACEVCRDGGRDSGIEPALHLAASAGRSVADPNEAWDRVDGAFHRFAPGERKVGQIGRSGQPLEIPDVDPFSPWVADSDWVRREGITGFGGQPLVHQGRVLGVLAVFTRAPLDEGSLGWLRMVANHAAAAIATARAFEEVEGLRRRLELEAEYLRGEVRAAHAYGRFVGRSPALDAVLRQIDLVAPTDAAVLVTGESGTGKELVAREIHARSRRAARPLIKVNCAAVPRDLYESEFFGHARGAFTGAARDRVGRFELADGGTLFLDEVGEIPPDLQPKLLRVLQEGEFERVGEERTRTADVRVIAATNRDLKREVAAGRFREDLYFRLNVFPIEVLPLRRRAEDVAPLAEHFLAGAAERLGRPVPRLTQADADRLRRYPWPGNVRELQHLIERAVIVSTGRRLVLDLPEAPPPAAPTPPVQLLAGAPDRVLTEAEFRELERQNVRAALRRAGGKIYGSGGAAELLGLKPTTLASRMKALGVRADEG
ncbi:sigma 54-interacting transcriptional regulator [bacterium]|nr:sigma 54-interacting transcriptional regulator [bacterium]